MSSNFTGTKGWNHRVWREEIGGDEREKTEARRRRTVLHSHRLVSWENWISLQLSNSTNIHIPKKKHGLSMTCAHPPIRHCTMLFRNTRKTPVWTQSRGSVSSQLLESTNEDFRHGGRWGLGCSEVIAPSSFKGHEESAAMGSGRA